jgi:methyl acetate hydrolase
VADVSTGRPVAADSLFRIASMTKAVTSAALMQLVEQGRIGLDDPAEKYLPELAGLKVLEKFDPATGDYSVRPVTKRPTVRGNAHPGVSAGAASTTPSSGSTRAAASPASL